LETELGGALGHTFSASFVLLTFVFHSLLRTLFTGSLKISPYLTTFLSIITLFISYVCVVVYVSVQGVFSCPSSPDTVQLLLCRRQIPVAIVGIFEQKTTWGGDKREMRRLICCKATMGCKGILGSVFVVNAPHEGAHVPLIRSALCFRTFFFFLSKYVGLIRLPHTE